MGKARPPVVGSRDSSNLTIALTIGYVRAQTGPEGVASLLALAEETQPLSELEDETRWSTQEQKIRPFEAAAVLLDDPLASRHIGETVLEQHNAASLKLLLRVGCDLLQGYLFARPMPADEIAVRFAPRDRSGGTAALGRAGGKAIPAG